MNEKKNGPESIYKRHVQHVCPWGCAIYCTAPLWLSRALWTMHFPLLRTYIYVYDDYYVNPIYQWDVSLN